MWFSQDCKKCYQPEKMSDRHTALPISLSPTYFCRFRVSQAEAVSSVRSWTFARQGSCVPNKYVFYIFLIHGVPKLTFKDIQETICLKVLIGVYFEHISWICSNICRKFSPNLLLESAIFHSFVDNFNKNVLFLT